MTFLSFPLYCFRRLAEGTKIGESRKQLLNSYFTPMKFWYFVCLSLVSPCWEQTLTIGAQVMHIACSDTSVIVINFRKSKTHAITDTYCTWSCPCTLWLRITSSRPTRLRFLTLICSSVESDQLWFQRRRRTGEAARNRTVPIIAHGG